MNGFVIIATYTLPTDLVIARSSLEAEGIKCITRDELTVQSYNLLSNAVGGVKLLVHVSQLEHALEILKVGGFLPEEPTPLSRMERLMNNPTTLKRLKRVSFLILGLLAAAVILLIGYAIINEPSQLERVVGHEWCVEHMVLGNEKHYP